MRFDYSCPEAPSTQMRAEIEEVANLAVRSNYEVGTEYLPFDEARKSGAMALFGEKYPNIVRVVDIGGPFSRELCGAPTWEPQPRSDRSPCSPRPPSARACAASKPPSGWTPSAPWPP